MKKSDIYKIIFVSYGLDNFDKGLFKEPTFDLDINKPRGGFWGSPINSDSSWGEWCKNNEYNIKSLDKHILFKVKKGSKICIIDDERDLKGHSINIPRYYYRRDDMIQDLKSRYPNAHRYEIENAVDDYLKRDSKSVLDFDFLKRYYDGIFVSANAVHKLRHVSNGDGLYWWDVESICIFNPDVIEIIPENAFEKAKVPSYEDGDGFISDDEYKKSKENRHHGYDDDNYDDIRMDYKQKQINKAYELYGNRNIDSDSSKLFNGEHPGVLAQGHGNNKNTKLAKKYNGTIKSGLDENKKEKNIIDMTKIQINENDIRQMVYKGVVKVLNENNFKTPFHRKRAAINIAGKKRGKTQEEIRQDILDAEAKMAAIKDINKERSVKSMSNHERRFNNSIKDNTFDTDFTELDYYDPYYDDFAKNNKEVEGLNPLIWQGSNDYQD